MMGRRGVSTLKNITLNQAKHEIIDIHVTQQLGPISVPTIQPIAVLVCT